MPPNDASPDARARAMTGTVVASASRVVTVGPDQPFCIVGERINPSGKPWLAAALRYGNMCVVEAEARRQVEAGAAMLDVNAGAPAPCSGKSEAALLAAAVVAVERAVDVPLVIDSARVDALQAALRVARGRPLVNSVCGAESQLDALLPVVRRHDVPVIALCHDGTGISPDPEVRFAIARAIVRRALDYGIAASDVVVDPLAMPDGVAGSAGGAIFPLIRRLRSELGVNTICGASNVSFGLPHRARINARFLARAIAGGLTAAILNPVSAPEMAAIRRSAPLQRRAFPLDAETG